MKNKNFIKLLGVFSLVVGFSSCQDDEQEYPKRVKPQVSVAANAYTVNEGEDLAIVLTSNTSYKTAMNFKLEIISQDTDEDDFTLTGASAYDTDEGWGTLGYKISFPAFATSHTVNLSAVLDDLAEGTETVTFRISTEGNLAGDLVGGVQDIVVSIVNMKKPNLDLTLDWNKSFNIGGTDYDLCGVSYDVDILVFDENGDPFGAGAQTGDCPEHLSMDMADYPDGSYFIVGYLYDDAGLSGVGVSPAFDIPVTVTYFRGGSATLDGVFVQNDDLLTSDSPSDTMSFIGTVEVLNGVFTIKNADDSVVASGKNATVLNKMKAAFKNRRK
ncbi:hypothetical protein [Flavobacterium sp.]|uniref:hypothetical protein n=1 Tax=Flavobacterium sp. TaxID=239 RepID=UPI00260C4493|nr:hypothetical protein [Flavobacterium sp.]